MTELTSHGFILFGHQFYKASSSLQFQRTNQCSKMKHKLNTCIFKDTQVLTDRKLQSLILLLFNYQLLHGAKSNFKRSENDQPIQKCRDSSRWVLSGFKRCELGTTKTHKKEAPKPWRLILNISSPSASLLSRQQRWLFCCTAHRRSFQGSLLV